jgi:ATP-dependent Clp protease protease subunit
MSNPPIAPQVAMAASIAEPGADIFRMLLKDRIVVLGSDVNDAVANQIVAQLLYLEGEDPGKDIWLYINSPGGSITAGMAIYDTMQFITPDVGTICMGLAASMGQFLLCAGAAGKRHTLPHARIMMHQPLGGVQGQASDIAIQAEQMAYIKRLMAERISFHTGQAVDQIEIDSERDRWFTAEQAHRRQRHREARRTPLRRLQLVLRRFRLVELSALELDVQLFGDFLATI